MSLEVYIPATKSLFISSQAVNKTTGEVIALTPNHKLLYFWCKDQYDFFESKGQKFFASWEEICNVLGITYNSRPTKKAIKELQTIGLIITEGSKKSNNKIVKRVDTILDWDFNNPQVEEFKTEEAIQVRRSSKQARIDSWKEKKKASGDWVDYKKNKETPKPSPVIDTPPAWATQEELPDPFAVDDFDFECPF